MPVFKFESHLRERSNRSKRRRSLETREIGAFRRRSKQNEES